MATTETETNNNETNNDNGTTNDDVKETSKSDKKLSDKKAALLKEINGLSAMQWKHFERNEEEIDVAICVHVHSLYNVDSSNQTFAATMEFTIERELTEQELIDYKENPDTFKPFLIKTYASQAQEIKQNELFEYFKGKPYYLYYWDHNNTAYCHTMNFYNVVFNESLELRNFPFDVQHYAVNIHLDCRDINMEWNWNEVNDKKNKIILKPDNTCSFTMESNALNVIGCDFFDKPYLELVTTKTGDVIVFEGIFILKREWQFYVSRVMVVLSIISFLTNLCFFFGDDSIPDRFGYISTTLLAAVAYMFITANYIPPLKYLTLLDIYIYFTFVYILLIAIENSLISAFENIGNISDIDVRFFFINLGIWILTHLLFVFKAYKAYQFEMTKYDKTKKEFDDDARIFEVTSGKKYGAGYDKRKDKIDENGNGYRNFIKTKFGKKDE